MTSLVELQAEIKRNGYKSTEAKKAKQDLELFVENFDCLPVFQLAQEIKGVLGFDLPGGLKTLECPGDYAAKYSCSELRSFCMHLRAFYNKITSIPLKKDIHDIMVCFCFNAESKTWIKQHQWTADTFDEVVLC